MQKICSTSVAAKALTRRYISMQYLCYSRRRMTLERRYHDVVLTSIERRFNVMYRFGYLRTRHVSFLPHSFNSTLSPKFNVYLRQQAVWRPLNYFSSFSMCFCVILRPIWCIWFLVSRRYLLEWIFGRHDLPPYIYVHALLYRVISV